MGLFQLNLLKLCNQSLKVMKEHLGFFGETNVQRESEERRESPLLRLQLVFGQIFLWITKLLL